MASLAVLLSILGSVTGAAAAGRHASMVIDGNSGKVLHDQAADEPRYPASLTKMMTLYIAFEMIEQGKLAPSTRIQVSERAAHVSPTKLGLKPGSTIALGDAIKALIVNSANDMAVAVAEHIASSEEQFAALMTRKAHQIGMAHTTFRNPHGLPDAGQITTARDMLTLALRLNDDFPQHYKLFSLKSFSYNGKSHRNHNTMLSTYEGMDGLKTGYTQASGFNLVASVRRDGKHVVAAVFGGSSAAARNVYMRAILNRSLPIASTEKTRKPALVAHAGTRTKVAKTARGPAIVAAAATPRLLEPVRPALVPAQQPVAAPKLAVTKLKVAAVRSTTGPDTGTQIEIARVKTVAVAPRVRAEPLPVPEVVPVAARPAPDATPPRMVNFAPSSSTFATTRAHGLGAPPSSLQAQADRLEQGRPALDTTAAAPPRAAAGNPSAVSIKARAAASGRAAVQVGAYASEAEAKRQLAATRSKAATLAAAEARTEPVTSGAKQLWRARFVGLDEQTASTACNDLRRHQVDCHVARMH